MNGRTPNTEPSQIVLEGVETRREPSVEIKDKNMSSTHDVAWAAGFFDGEGYVNIQKRSHPKYIGYYLRIGINHVAIEPLREIKRLFGGTVVSCNPYKNFGNRKIRHRWVTSTSNAAIALRMMMPYFRNKNAVAGVALDFQKTIQCVSKVKIPDDLQATREAYKSQIKQLNSLD